MNMYELYVDASGVGGGFENFFKNAVCKGAFYVHFASYRSYVSLYEAFSGIFSGLSAFFMNYMKIYEVGIFKRFFWKRAFFSMDFMKLGKCPSSYCFMSGGVMWTM